LKVLADNFPPGFNAHFNKRLLQYTTNENTNEVDLSFADGTVANADIIIGADGVNSATRASMYRELSKDAELNGKDKSAMSHFIHPTWTGTYAYRTLVNTSKLSAIAPDHRALTSPLMVSDTIIFLNYY